MSSFMIYAADLVPG